MAKQQASRKAEGQERGMGKCHCPGGNGVLGAEGEWMPTSQNSKQMSGKGAGKD